MTSLRSHDRGTARAGLRPHDVRRFRVGSHDRRRPAVWLKARVRPDDRVRITNVGLGSKSSSKLEMSWIRY